MPISRKCSAGPMPDSMRICGVLKAPAETITSWPAFARVVCPFQTYSTPVARVPSISTRVVSAPVVTVRLGRFSAGLRYAAAADERRPLRMEYWLRPKPSCVPAL